MYPDPPNITAVLFFIITSWGKNSFIFGGMKKLRVLHITEPFATGVYTYLEDLSEIIQEHHEIENTIVYSANRKGTPKIDLLNKTKLIELDMSPEINFKKDFKSAIKLYKLIQGIQPDVIHLHSSKAGVLGRIVSIFYKKKHFLLYTAHGFSFLRKDISKIKRFFFFNLELCTSKLSKVTIIACGDTELEYSKKLSKRTCLVRNGINFKYSDRFNKKPSANKITIGILSRITAARNPEFFNRIALTFPDLNFVWIGDGEMKSLITSPNIKVTGWFTKKEDGLNHLNDLDIYLQTSLWEGLPIAVLEAMSFKKPVIASNVVGNKDAIKHGETGFLYNNFEDACSYIKLLVKDRELRNSMGVAGYERCRNLFDVSKNFKSLIDIYRTCGR